MIVDLRIYTVRPGKAAEFVQLYQEHGWPVQSRILGRCLGYYTTVEGTLNQIVHIWAYDSQADREARRAAMAADPEWHKYIAISGERALLVSQENRMMKPTEFSPQ